MSEERDRLLDALLAETLGEEQPPDLTERICKRAFAQPAHSSPWVLGAGIVAAAALVAVVVSLCLRDTSKPPLEVVEPRPQPAPEKVPYPTPTVTGSFEVVGGGTPGRGATILAKGTGATMALGGYCEVRMEAGSSVRIDGKEKEEEILLQDGRVTCEVERSHGSFTVKTPLGKVSVTGTKFRVEMRKGDEDMTRRSMYIKVLAGTVLVASAWGESALAAGQEHEQPNQGRLTGIVTAKTEKSITVRDDLTNEAKQFMPNWIGGMPKDGGGLDKKVLNAIREVPVGSHVLLEWKLDEHLRILGLKVLERPANALHEGERKVEGAHRDGEPRTEGPREGDRKPEIGGDKSTPKEAGPGEGVLVGKVSGKGENWIEVQGEHQDAASRYTPRWIGGLPKDGGGLDKHMLATFRELKVGELIRLTWMEDERLRAIKIERPNAR